MGNTKAHVVYMNKDGIRLPGGSTIARQGLDPWSLQYLIKWANELGLQGQDSSKTRDEAGAVGTCCHLMAECHFKKEEPDLSDFTPNQVNDAKKGFARLLAWEKKVDITPILVEKALVSEEHQYGGTIDLYAEIKTKDIARRVLIDFKTSKTINVEHLIQICGYKHLLIENNYPVDDCWILKLRGESNRACKPKEVEYQDIYWQIFLSCLNIYKLKRKISKGV